MNKDESKNNDCEGAEKLPNFDERTSRSCNSSNRQHRARLLEEKDSRYYNMKHKKRGIAVIFNHESFDDGLKPRIGTDVDCLKLGKALKGIGFEVTTYQDLNAGGILNQLRGISKMDHTDHDCLLIAVLTHGEDGILYAKDTQYKTECLWNNFSEDNCPTLTGKPKLFFIQACQGRESDTGITLKRTETDGRSPFIQACQGEELNTGITLKRTETDGWSPFKMPNYPDFLIAFSIVPSYVSWRNTEHGSWFIQALVQELTNTEIERHILILLTAVCQRVALDFESYTPDDMDMHQQKQIPCIISMLTRLLVFP